MGEVEEFNFAKERDLDGRGSESPRVGIRAEFETGQKQANTCSWARAGDQRELGEDIRGTRAGYCDPDQTALGLGCLDLASHTGDWDFRRSRFPLALGAEPCDRLFVRLDLGRRGVDGPGADDLFEFGAGRVVEDGFGWIGAGWDLVGAGDGDELDVDLHGVFGSVGADGDRSRGSGKEPLERSAAMRGRAKPADGDFCAQ